MSKKDTATTEMTAKKEVIPAETQSKNESEVAIFIQQAIENKLPVEVMEKLFTLQEKVKAQRAKEEFVRALAGFQAEVPVIKKTKQVLNSDGRTIRYQYAPIDSIIEQIKRPLADNGLSFTWEIENKTGFIKATAKVTHIFGHTETSSFEIPIDTKGYMTVPQQYASALTFAKRYALCNALGISTADEDTDATDVNIPPNVKSEKSRIVFLLRALGHDTATKEKVEAAVKKIAQLGLEQKNYKEIISRLEVTLKEKQEHENPKV